MLHRIPNGRRQNKLFAVIKDRIISYFQCHSAPVWIIQFIDEFVLGNNQHSVNSLWKQQTKKKFEIIFSWIPSGSCRKVDWFLAKCRRYTCIWGKMRCISATECADSTHTKCLNFCNVANCMRVCCAHCVWYHHYTLLLLLCARGRDMFFHHSFVIPMRL